MAGTSDRVRAGNSYPIDPRYGGSGHKGFPNVERRKGTVPTYGFHEDEPPEFRKVEMEARLHHEALGFENKAYDPELQQAAKAAVQLSMRDTYNVMENLRNKWLTLYRNYRGDTLSQVVHGEMALHEPEPFKAVETVHPRMMRAMFQQMPNFGIRGYDWQDDESAKHQVALITDNLNEIGYKSIAGLLFREFMIYGTCIQKTFWRQKIEEVRYQRVKRVPTDREGVHRNEVQKVAREEMTFDANDVKPVSIFDVFAPPTVNPVDAPWTGDQSLWPSYDIVAMGEQGLWLNLAELKGHPGGENTTMSDEYKERKFYSAGVYDSREAAMSPHVAHYKVFDWWGPLDIDKNGVEVPCNVTIIDPDSKNLVAVIRKNPFWHGKSPYQVARYIGLHEEFFGIGMLEPIARMTYELDSKKNQYHVATALESNPMLVAADDANIHDAQLVATPGLVLRAGNADGIKPLFIPKVSDAALQAMTELKTSIRETTGVTAPVMGAQRPGGGSSKTLGQHTSEVNESNMRITGPLENFEDELFLPMVNQMAWNNMQFLSRKKTINVLGPHGLRYHDRYTVDPTTITGRFAPYAVASQRLSTQMIQTQQLINLLDRAIPLNEASGMELIKIRPLLAKIFREGFGFRDAAEFIAIDPREAGLVSSIEEHEAWMNGIVPGVRDMDNHVDHYASHAQFFDTPAFQWLEENLPHIAAEARTHAVRHMTILTGNIELEGQMLASATQQGQVANAGQNGAQAGGRGFAEAGADPQSPNFRSDQGPSEQGQSESEGTMSGPNPGAS